jgi:hypothetical protein
MLHLSILNPSRRKNRKKERKLSLPLINPLVTFPSLKIDGVDWAKKRAPSPGIQLVSLTSPRRT